MNPQLPFSFRGILTALTLAFSLAAAPANEAFDRANADYEAGRYQQAVDGYTALLEKEGPRAAVLQNLGSAWYRLGDLGRAILNFERAQLLDPNHAALKANLKLARDAAAAFSETPESRRWMAWTNWLSRRAWSVVILLGTGLLPLAAACWWLGGGTRLRRWVLPVAGCGFLLATMGYLALGESADVDQRAVVIRPATVRISPFAAAESKGSLAPGKDVRLGQERDGWFQVVAASGLQGWVSAEEVAPLIPR